MNWLFEVVFLFASLRFAISFYNWLFKAVLPTSWTQGTPVKLSVLIPARNEERQIELVIKSVLAQQNVLLELLVLDDHSTDATAKIAKAAMQGDVRARLIEGKSLPEGWLGKSWACHQLAQEATGDWLLFIDADVQLAPDAATRALNYVQNKKLDALSVFPFQEMRSFGERLTVPLMHQLLLSLLPLNFIRWFKQPSLAAANGQFLLLSAAVYRSQQPHEQVRNDIVEDIAIFRRLKLAGKRVMTLTDPTGTIRCRMYHNLDEGVRGFSKNVLAGFGYSIPGLIVYLCLTAYLWPVLWFWVPIRELIALTAVILLSRVMILRTAGQPVLLNLLLHIPQLIVFHWIAWRSIYLKLTNTYEWKGRVLR